MQTLNPVTVRVLIWHYYSHEKYPEESRSIDMGYATLHDVGLLADNNDITDKGRAYVDAMLDLPLPEKRTVWIVPERGQDDTRERVAVHSAVRR